MLFFLLACAPSPDSGTTDSSAGDSGALTCAGGIDVGDCPPDVTLVDQDGTATSLLGLSGAATVLSSEAGWCSSCQQQAMDLEALYESREGDGLAIITIIVEGRNFAPSQASDAAEWADSLGLTYPVLADPDRVFLPAYGGDISSAPFVYYVLDGEGVVTWRRLEDEVGMVDQIEAQVNDILGG